MPMKRVIEICVVGTTLLISLSARSQLSATSVLPRATTTGSVLKGSVYGGRRPVSGASIYLYAAGSGGYGTATQNLLTSAVTTNSTGNFDVSGKYSCAAGQQMYLVSLGGSTVLGKNNAAGFMAALGDCSWLSSSRYISMNEVTTVAGAFALAPFMTSYSAVSSSATNYAGMVRAFASARKLANIGTGQSPGGGLALGATAPVSEVYTVANVLAACVKSAGGVAGDGSTCGKLFASATPAGGFSPTETIGLALAMAHHPTLNVATQFSYTGPLSAFGGQLTSAPKDWTMSISYAGFHAPKSTTIDAAGNVWVANSGSSTVTVLAQSGAVVRTLSGNGLSSPAAVAIDVNGSGFVANRGASSVSGFTSKGVALSGSPFAVGAGPTALAFDGGGFLWVANSAGNSVSELNGAGTPVQTISTGVAAPTAVAINPQ